MQNPLSTWLATAALVCVTVIGAGWLDLTRLAPAVSLTLGALPADPVLRGERLFRDGDLGVLDLDTLETNALPWIVLSTALALEQAEGDLGKVSPALVESAFSGVGFLFPSIDGAAGLRTPLGVNLGRVERLIPPLRVTTANLGCASCHAGVGYDARGLPQPGRPVPGMPNSSLDLEAYAQLVYRALKRVFADEDAFWQAVARLHPSLSWREEQSLRWIVLPRARARMTERAQAGDTPLPFSNGAPGLTNGVAALKLRLGLVSPHGRVADGGFVSIPDLADRGYRSALLADGAYVLPGRERFHPRSAAEARQADPVELARIGSFFTVPSMGMSPERAKAAIPALTDIARYLARYRPQTFPGPIDRARLPLGQAAYARDCASCHGYYDADLERPKLLRFPNWAGDVGTDMGRANAFDAALAVRVNATAYRDNISAAATGKLAAPLLSGVWASAPISSTARYRRCATWWNRRRGPSASWSADTASTSSGLGWRWNRTPPGCGATPPTIAASPARWRSTRASPAFRTGGHEEQVRGLSAEEREALLEYLKLL